MPEFIIRSWSEQTLFACKDYVIEADTLGDAAKIIHALQEKAEDTIEVVTDQRVRALSRYESDEIEPLDPEEIVDGSTGLTLIDEKGVRLRDLVSIPTGCPQLGEFLDVDFE